MDTPLNQNSNEKREEITVQGTRVFRPYEVKKLIDVIPKRYHRIMFEALLYTGMRYVELMRLKQKPEMFKPNSNRIHLDKFAIRKKKIKIKERYVILNPIGKRVIESYLELDKELPTHNDWRADLKRWCCKANMLDTHLSTKSTRKTWESWLVTTYPQYTHIIFLSQGHDAMTALKHYVTLPYSPQDKMDMKEYVYGWEP